MEPSISRECPLTAMLSVFVLDSLILEEVSDQMAAPCAGARQGQVRGPCTSAYETE